MAKMKLSHKVLTNWRHETNLQEYQELVGQVEEEKQEQEEAAWLEYVSHKQDG
jgi:hypothetical protein